VALVQTSTLLRTENSGATSTLSYTSNLAAGSLSVLCVGNYPSAITSVSGSTNGAYTRAVNYGDGGNNYVEIWYRANTSAGAETLTITPTSASGNYITAVAQEWSGMATSSPLDQTGTSGTLTVSTTGATTQANEVVFTVAVADAGSSNVNWGTPTGYTLIARENDSNTYTGLQAAQKTVSSTGTQSATHTNSSVSADTIIATFKVASGSKQEQRAFTSTTALSSALVSRANNRKAFTAAGVLSTAFASRSQAKSAFTSSAALASSFDSAQIQRAALTAAAVLSASLGAKAQARTQFTSSSSLTSALASRSISTAAISWAAALSSALDSQYQARAAFTAGGVLSVALDAIDGASGEEFRAFAASASLAASFVSDFTQEGLPPSRPHKPRGQEFYRSVTGLQVSASFKTKAALSVSFDTAKQASDSRAVEVGFSAQVIASAVFVSESLYQSGGLVRTYKPAVYQLERV
jgi:hypothetical protein